MNICGRIIFSLLLSIRGGYSVVDNGTDMEVKNERRCLIPQTTNPLKLSILVEPSPFTYTSGYSNRYKELLRYLMEEEVHDVEIVTAEVFAKDPPAKAFGFPIHYTRAIRLRFYDRVSLSMDWNFQVYRKLRKFRPNIIHVSSPGPMVISAVICSRLLHIPLVMSYHTHLPVYVQAYFPRFSSLLTRVIWWWLWLTHSMADLTLLTSAQIKDEFKLHGIPRIDIWQKGIDTDQFHPRFSNRWMRNKMIGREDCDDDHLLLLYVGRLAAEKRISKLKKILDQLPNASLCIIGAGPEEDSLKEEFADTPANFLGELHGEELSQAYASADIFCFPSDSETLGFVIMEAMASGLPVVAANAGGIPSIIEDGKTGYLVTETHEYVDRINKIRKDPQKRRDMAIQARQATEEWSWNASMSKLVSVQYPEAQANYKNRWSTRIWRAPFRQERRPTDESNNNPNA